MNSRHALIPMLAAVVACGSSGSTGPSPAYANIAGTYSGTVAGSSSGVAPQGTFSLTVTQSGANIHGTFSVNATLFDGVNTYAGNGGGSLAGSVGSAGSNPPVNVTATYGTRHYQYGTCASDTTHFSGTYDSTNHVLTLTGAIPFSLIGCKVALTYPNAVISLSK